MNKTIRLFVVAVLLVALLVGLESASIAWLGANARINAMAASVPAAYAHSSYFSPEFLQEQGHALDAMADLDWDGFTYKDFRGQWINFDAGLRRTTDTPDNAPHTLWLAGASTLVGFEVPDNLTIASYLQRAVRQRYRVVNVSQSGATVMSNLRRLKTMRILPGDVVVLYGGANELQAFEADPMDAEIGGLLCQGLKAKLPRLAMGRAYCKLYQGHMGVSPVRRESAVLNFAHALAAASEYVRQQGATAYFFLQPMAYSATPTSGERLLLDNPFVNDPTSAYVARHYWTDAQLALRVAREYDTTLTCVDLTHSLDAMRLYGESVYVDFDHMTESGNAAVAAAIVHSIGE